MPRPSKHVSPDTLGGRIRAAREQLQLSLAEVAGNQYSPSLISQIERNRIEPSVDSLRYLAERLHLPLEDLQYLAQQNKETEDQGSQPDQLFEETRARATLHLQKKEIAAAIQLLEHLYLPEIPPRQRWRLAALRGQCFFEQRKFLRAQQDFIYALSICPPEPKFLPQEQRQDLMLLHLHLAGTCRELQQPEDALEHYRTALHIMDRSTPSGYVAEAHWGMALLASSQAFRLPRKASERHQSKEASLQTALKHAEQARSLYCAINDQLSAAAVTHQIAQLEYALGQHEHAQAHLQEILHTWLYTLKQPPASTREGQRRQKEEASVVSGAACLLADIALEEKRFDEARKYANLALEAGQRSYKRRRADAYTIRGRILEAIDPHMPEVEEAFRNATRELADTQRISARISAHVRLARHYLKIGKIQESEHELEQARLLSDLVSHSGDDITTDELSSA
uniref:HTH cro/C1-type domain-containing protein n=1 Tax=Thermosporothrix sp. COM3 TaxID=2490863 RepID=A0A455SUT1_9CHLR|nr:hypothetical protein KTC_61370 [Thermosporothrix sp. COM3]